MKILITGGHLTPALAFIDYLRTHHPEHQIEFIGRIYSQDDRQLSRETWEINQRNLPFHPLTVPKWQSPVSPANWWALAKLPLVYWRAWRLVKRIRPDILISFGSYLAVPVAVASAIQGIPILTHEQTTVAGQANRLIAYLAKKVALSFPQSRDFFPADKIVWTGNCLRPEILSPPLKPSWLPTKINHPIIYVTGGNQGSLVINQTMTKIIPELVKRYLVIHVCGRSTIDRPYWHDLSQIQSQLSPRYRFHYQIFEWLNPQDLNWVYHHASLAISRAGANTVYELGVKQLPTIFIPLPTSKYQEQLHNAQILAQTGGAIILPQAHLTPDQLLKIISRTAKYRTAMKRRLSKLTWQLDGAAQLYQLAVNITN